MGSMMGRRKKVFPKARKGNMPRSSPTSGRRGLLWRLGRAPAQALTPYK